MTETMSRALLQGVPEIDIEFTGNVSQANGLQLPIAVINLPHRTDRWQCLVQRMSVIGLDNLIKVPAIDGRRLPKALIEPLLAGTEDIDHAPKSHLGLTRPAVGCFLSHVAVWRWMLRRGLPRVLILEDDARPSEHNTPERIRDLIGSLDSAADHVFLGRIIMHGLAEAPAGLPLQRLYYFNGTFAYLVTAHACARLIRELLPMRAHIDHQTSQYLIEHRRDYRAFYCEPAMFEPDWTQRSDCYVPIVDEGLANTELGNQLQASRDLLISEGTRLLPPHR